jgi:hypothetical protein
MEPIKDIIYLLEKYTHHNHIKLVNRGNSAIKLAMQCCSKLSDRKNLIIPDEGGWITYQQFPEELGFNKIELKTDKGLLDLKELEKESKNAACLIYANPAGYFAHQDTESIYATCKKNDCLVILDVSGCVGDPELCTGEYADIVVGSFGRWKPINLEHGGFIGFRKKAYELKIESKFKDYEFNPDKLVELKEKLESVKDRLRYLYGINLKIKEDLKDFNILHPDKRGINVIISYNSESEKNKIIDYCKKEDYEYTQCPRYIRVNSNAISIEVKRLNN